MKRTLLVGLLVLAGCDSEAALQSDVAHAEAQCQGNEGLKSVKVLKTVETASGRNAKLDVQCWNGASFDTVAQTRP